MRKWHVEYLGDRAIEVPPWAVKRDDGMVYAYCIDQAMAANVCSALNFHEQWVNKTAYNEDKGIDYLTWDADLEDYV